MLTPSEIYFELSVRGLIAAVHDKMRRFRPLISRATILEAYKIEDYHLGNPLQKRILDVSKKVIEDAESNANALTTS